MKEIWEDIPNYEGLYQASNLGRIRSVDRYKEVIIKNQYDLKGNYIKTWEIAKEIEKKLKIKNSQICRCCKNENSTAGGYHWKYERKGGENICN